MIHKNLQKKLQIDKKEKPYSKFKTILAKQSLKKLVPSNIPHLKPIDLSKVASTLKVNKVVIDELEPWEIRELKLKHKPFDERAELMLNLNVKDQFNGAKVFQLKEIIDLPDVESNFASTTQPENLIEVIAENFTKEGITLRTLELNIADIIFLVGQNYETLLKSTNFEILISVVCEALLFNVFKHELNTRKGLALLFKCLENFGDEGSLDVELLISNTFQIWQRFHKKKHVVMDAAFGCLCMAVHKLKKKIVYLPDPIKMMLMGNCFLALSSMFHLLKADSSLSMFKHSHWIIESPLSSTLTRITFVNNFQTKDSFNKLVAILQTILFKSKLITEVSVETALDILTAYGLILKNCDTLSLIETKPPRETIIDGINMFFQYIYLKISYLLERDYIENLEECLSCYFQIYTNKKYFERNYLPFDNALYEAILLILSKPLQKIKFTDKKIFKRKTYSLIAEKLTKIISQSLENLIKKSPEYVVNIVKTFKLSLDEVISFLQEDKTFIFDEAKIASKNIVMILNIIE